MQRVSAFLPSWDKRSSNSGAPKPISNGVGIFGWAARNSANNGIGNNTVTGGSSNSGNKLAKSLARINVAAANEDRVQREAFWPSTLDMESLKAARILKSFCSDGFLAPVEGETAVPPTVSATSTSDLDPQSPASVMKKIPKRIIQNAAGIAVFTCMRSGLWMTGSGGSGILIARKSDGTWSPPSGIMLHTPTLSFIIGVDVYDCVLVVTNLAALESITRPRVTLGDDVSLNNGPSTTLDSDDVKLNWKDLDNTVLAYMKARGQHQAVNLQGCILTERANENERFYGAEVTQMDILAGNVTRHVEETKPLFEVIKLAEGRTDYDKAVIELTAVEPVPSDAIIATPKSNAPSPRPSFGIVKADDPDPFGVLALEMAGLEIRQAGSRPRPASSQFDITSNPRSPSFYKFDRESMDTFVSKNNRASVRSSNTIKSQMTDAGTQTDTGTGNTPQTTPSPGQSENGRERASIDHVPDLSDIAAVVDYTAADLSPLKQINPRLSIAPLHPERPAIPPRRRPISSAFAPQADKVEPTVKTPSSDQEGELEYDTNDADDEDDEDDSDEEAVVFEVAQVQPTRTRAVASRMIHAKGSVVTIPKRIAPPLPTRSPARNSRCTKSDIGVENTTAFSSLRQAFSEADLRSEEEKKQNRVAERSSAMLETSKSADLDQTHTMDAIRGTKSEEVPRQLTQVDESAQVTPSIDAVVMPGNAHKQANSLLLAVASEQTASVDMEVAIAASFPLPEDIDPKHTSINDTESEYGAVGERVTGDEEDFKTSQEPVDNSDSTTTSKKHTSSIYTGLTEDRWSIDRSSLTTPISERPMSVAEYTTEEDTPKKTNREEDLLKAEKENIFKTAVKKPLNTPSRIPIEST
ncbi:hypothetical protein EsDP_00001159 [Epichloe bromicola]|uniref:Ysc84 actin-binding domain-containing protein n=1 Tax=Epichloe bromicola TaxID=79588 RepID=A0ABQ0CH16_9HYPO